MITPRLAAAAVVRRRLRLRSLVSAIVVTLGGVAALPGPSEARPIARADVVRLATAGPHARAARARADGFRAAAEESGAVSLEQPEVSVTAGPRLHDGMTRLAFGAGLSVPVDVFGQRAARVDAAEAEARAAEAEGRGAVAAPLREALTLHAEALAARARRAVLADRLRLVEDLAATALRKREAGEVADNDVAVVRLQLGRERAAMANLDGDVAALEQRLAAVLALPDGEAAEATGPLVPAESPGRPAPSLAVAAAEAHTAAARARVAREEAARRPTIRLLGAYELDEGAHVVTGGLAIPLPLYGAGDAGVAVARGEAMAAEHALGGTRRRALGEQQVSRIRVEATRRALEATRPTALEARAIVERAQRAYAAGESDLTSLLLVRREALESEVALVDAELAHALAVLDALLLDGRWAR